MAKVNIAAEMLEKHTDEELIEFLYSEMTGVMKNYRNSMEQKMPEICWASMRNLDLIADVLMLMKRRNQARQVQNDML